MTKIKEPTVANIFYPGVPEELKAVLDGYSEHSVNNYQYPTRAIISPHAGWMFSGPLAYEAISLLDKNIKHIFVFAPSHKVDFEGLALSTYDEWNTPYGNIKINHEVNKQLIDEFGAKYFDEALKEEHSIEVQVPMIQHIFEDATIIPVLICKQNAYTIADIIEKYYENKEFGFIVSSDLSHFLTDEQAQKIDEKTAEMIETGDILSFRFEQACGARGIFGLVEFANRKKFSMIRTGMYNTSEVTQDKSRVVGYGGWFLYEGSKNQFLKEYYSEFIIDLCKKVIKSRFDENYKFYTNHPGVFNELGACFVTLKKNNNLRGCIGSIIAHQPLVLDLIQHAQDAAFGDSRFNPLTEEEFEDLTIDVSLLSVPTQIEFTDENDLLEKIVPFSDGIIIQDGNHQAVYLPSVWEDLPDKVEFMQSLKIKAGLSPDYFSENFKAFRFYTEYIEE